jgi:hypothetical protein
MKRASALFFFAAFSAWSGLAGADPIKAGTFALSGERLTGFYHSSYHFRDPNGEVDTSVDHFAFLGEQSHGTNDVRVPYEMPRIGFDGFVIDGLSIGGSLVISHTSTAQTVAAGGGSLGGPTLSATDFLIAPRVGYALMFSDHIGFWPRGGLSYYHESADLDRNNRFGVTTTSNAHAIAFDAEVPFLFLIVPNFGITAGPTFDVSLDASQTRQVPNGSITTGTSYLTFGIAAGLLGLF